MEKWELEKLDQYFNEILPYMTEEGKAEVERVGKYTYDQEFGWVTPTINGGICAYGRKDATGTILIRKSKRDPDVEYVNYHPREDLCKPGCKLGNKLKVPVYVFLKDALIRKYGEEFYETLAATAAEMKKNNNE